MRRRLVRLVVLGAVVLLALQLVPYGWWHENPVVVRDAPWPDQATADLARGACYDCHSNETAWPAYSYVAPMSWLVRRDVEQGREELNLSLWDEFGDEADDAAEAVEDGSMPPGQYQLLHPDARLSDAEAAALVAALEAMDPDEAADRDDDADDEADDEADDRDDGSGPGGDEG